MRLYRTVIVRLHRRALYAFLAVAAHVLIAPLAAARAPKVIILPFSNVDQNPDSAYLESTITEAVRKELQGKFVFKEIDETRLKHYAQDNLIESEDFYTASAGMQLGSGLKQDVVIQGYYRLVKNKQAAWIVTHVRIIDIGKKRRVADFDVVGKADANIFDSISKMTARLADEAKAVLPNEAEWKKSGSNDDNDDAPLYQQILLSAGFSTMSQPAAISQKINSATILMPSDVTSLLFFHGEFQRHHFLFRNLFFWAAGGYNIGTRAFDADQSSKTVQGKYTAIEGLGGLGYRSYFRDNLYYSFFGGGGYNYGKLTLNYQNLEVLPVNSAGDSVSEGTLLLSAPMATAEIRFGWEPARRIAFEMGVGYTRLFYRESSTSRLLIKLGVGYRF